MLALAILGALGSAAADDENENEHKPRAQLVITSAEADDPGPRGAGDVFAIQWGGYQIAMPVSRRDAVVRIP